MRQRVNVARALAMDPEMLLLDEPLSALDALTRANLADEIEAIWEADKKTCVLITNDVDEAILLADRIIVAEPGRQPGRRVQSRDSRARATGSAMNNGREFQTPAGGGDLLPDGCGHQGAGRGFEDPAGCDPDPRASLGCG